jgi:hypothetical protein
MLWRRKQGKGDWEDSALDSPAGQSSRSNTFTGDLGGYSRGSGVGTTDDEDEWDIEQAVQNRVVQVMFTVPKEKLRVVNHDIADDMSTSDIASLRSKQGSGKSLKDFGASMEGVVGMAQTTDRPVVVASPLPAMVAESAPTSTLDKGKGRLVEDEIPILKTPRSTYKAKGKERELDLVREMEREVQQEFDAERDAKRRELRRPKSKVLEMVETMERRASPERSL